MGETPPLNYIFIHIPFVVFTFHRFILEFHGQWLHGVMFISKVIFSGVLDMHMEMLNSVYFLLLYYICKFSPYAFTYSINCKPFPTLSQSLSNFLVRSKDEPILLFDWNILHVRNRLRHLTCHSAVAEYEKLTIGACLLSFHLWQWFPGQTS